jgi:hypothetical protein
LAGVGRALAAHLGQHAAVVALLGGQHLRLLPTLGRVLGGVAGLGFDNDRQDALGTQPPRHPHQGAHAARRLFGGNRLARLLQLLFPDGRVSPLAHRQVAKALRPARIALGRGQPFIEGGAVALVLEIQQPDVLGRFHPGDDSTAGAAVGALGDHQVAFPAAEGRGRRECPSGASRRSAC